MHHDELTALHADDVLEVVHDEEGVVGVMRVRDVVAEVESYGDPDEIARLHAAIARGDRRSLRAAAFDHAVGPSTTRPGYVGGFVACSRPVVPFVARMPRAARTGVRCGRPSRRRRAGRRGPPRPADADEDDLVAERLA